MSADATAAEERQPPRFLRALRALGDRRMLAMLLMSFAAGIPYGAVLGALNAWLDSAGVKPAEIGVLSFIILAYSFKFIWSPAFLQPRSPFPRGLGPRRNWLILFQIAIAACLLFLSRLDPAQSIWLLTCAALAVTVMSATHDIVLDAWRIEVARSDEDKDLMSALYQFGYRFAGLLTGAVALVLSDYIPWGTIYILLAAVMALSIVGTLVAPEPKHGERKSLGEMARSSGIAAGLRRPIIWALALGWVFAIYLILSFMGSVLNFSPETLPDGTETRRPSPRDFTLYTGPWIVVLFIIVPGIVAALLMTQKKGGGSASVSAETSRPSAFDRAGDALFASIVLPLMDLIKRFGWGIVLILSVVLTYRFADLVWGSFAFPFYLGANFGALGHTGSEIAFASKTFGVIMTISGSLLGAIALVFLGRMPCLVIGGFLAAITNLLFADMAAGRFDPTQGLEVTTNPEAGGAAVLAFLKSTGLYGLFEGLASAFAAIPFFKIEVTEGLVALTAAIAAENLAVGFASVAMVAFYTSIVNPKYAAVQYALLASLTMVIGSLGRGWLGELIEDEGFYDVFVITFWIGLIPAVLALAEWIRQGFQGSPADTLKDEEADLADAKEA